MKIIPNSVERVLFPARPLAPSRVLLVALGAIAAIGTLAATGFLAYQVALWMIPPGVVIATLIGVTTLIGLVIATPKYLSPEKRVSQEQLVTQFWQDHFDQSNLKRIFQMVQTNSHNHKKNAQFLVDHYATYLASKETPIDASDKKHLRAAYLAQFHSTKRPKTSQIISLSDTQNLHIHITDGKGNCGIHALFGNLVNGSYHHGNVQHVRTQFCKWLTKKFNDEKAGTGQVPSEIKQVLTDYFYHFELAPTKFKTPYVRERVESLLNNYQFSTTQKLKMFMQDDKIFEAYLDNLETDGTYLLQEELIVLARSKGIKLTLHQPNWGVDAKCQTLQKQWKQGQLPDEHKQKLKAYQQASLSPSVPNSFNTKSISVKSAMLSEEKFMADKEVFMTYLNMIRQEVGSATFNSTGTTEVHVWFNHRHYQRAAVKPA